MLKTLIENLQVKKKEDIGRLCLPILCRVNPLVWNLTEEHLSPLRLPRQLAGLRPALTLRLVLALLRLALALLQILIACQTIKQRIVEGERYGHPSLYFYLIRNGIWLYVNVGWRLGRVPTSLDASMIHLWHWVGLAILCRGGGSGGGSGRGSGRGRGRGCCRCRGRGGGGVPRLWSPVRLEYINVRLKY